MATLGMSAADRDAVERFRRDVIEPSRTSLIIIDFWAEWCGPCRQLTPVLEKVAEDYAAKGVRLVKINVDEEKLIAAQFRIQSIPTVYAIFDGQPVADLTSARTETQLKRMLDQILAQLPLESGDAQAQAQAQAEIEPLIQMGEDVLAAGDAPRAVNIFGQVREMVPDHPQVASGLIRALVAAGEIGEARALLDTLPEEVAKDGAVARARSAVELAESAPVGEEAAFEQRIAADPDDHQARFDLAGAKLARGDRDGAADQLLESIRRDRDWNEGAARRKLLQAIEAVGLEDPWAGQQRRRLSAILFT